MAELNYCPACKGEVKIRLIKASYGMDGTVSDWQIYCLKCGAHWTYPADDFFGRRFYLKPEVINLWNHKFGEEQEGADI